MFGHKLHGDVFEGHEGLSSQFPLSPLGSYSGLPFGEGAFSGVSLSHPFFVPETDSSSSDGDNSPSGLSDSHTDTLSLSMPLTSTTVGFDASDHMHQLVSAFAPTFDTFHPFHPSHQQESAFEPSSSSLHLACAPAPESASSFVLKVEEPSQEFAPSSTSEAGVNSEAHSDDVFAQTSAQGSASMAVSSHHEQEEKEQEFPKIDLFLECRRFGRPCARARLLQRPPEIEVAIVNAGDPEDVVTYKRKLNMALSYMVEKFDAVISNRKLNPHLDGWMQDAKEEYRKQYQALMSSNPVYKLANDCYTNIEKAFSRPINAMKQDKAGLKKYVNKNVADLREIASHLTKTDTTEFIRSFHVKPFENADIRNKGSKVPRSVQGLVPMAVDSSHEQKKQGRKRKRQSDVFAECRLVESPNVRSKTCKLPPKIEVAIINVDDPEAVAIYKERLNMILTYLIERFEIFHCKGFNLYLDEPMRMAKRQYKSQYRALESSHPLYRLANACLSNINQAFSRTNDVLHAARYEIQDYVNENVKILEKIVAHLTTPDATEFIRSLHVVPFKDSDFGKKYPVEVENKKKIKTGNESPDDFCESSIPCLDVAPVGSSVSHSGAPLPSVVSHSLFRGAQASAQREPSFFSSVAAPAASLRSPSPTEQEIERQLLESQADTMTLNRLIQQDLQQSVQHQIQLSQALEKNQRSDAIRLNEQIKEDLQQSTQHQSQLTQALERSQLLTTQLSLIRNGTGHLGLLAQSLGLRPSI